MIARIWRTGVAAARWSEYERYAGERSRPMFEQQPGCLGVFFARTGPASAAVISLWRDMESIERLATSQTYQRTARGLSELGVLEGEQTVEVWPLHGGWVWGELGS